MGERERLKSRLRENPTLTHEEFHQLLDAYQVASGHHLGVEGIRALLEVLAEGRPLHLLPFAAGETRVVRSHDELAEVVAAYDASIDLRDAEEFRGFFRGSPGRAPHQA